MRASIEDHYLTRFESKTSQSESGHRSVGMEAKFCLTDEEGNAVPPSFLKGMFDHLSRSDWILDYDRNLGVATRATRETGTYPAMISTGTGHCKIELSVPYGDTVGDLEHNLTEMVEDVKAFLSANGAHLLCLGVHPITVPEPDMVQKKVRHVFWDQVFKSGLVHLFAISSDCQIHVDIAPEEVHAAVNVLQGFSGPQIALTANATVWRGEVDTEHLDVREAFWDWWLEGEDRAGMSRRPFSSLGDYAERIASLRPVFIMRGGESLGIYHYPSFREYYDTTDGAFAVNSRGLRVEVMQDERDIDLHDTFNWYTCRLSHYGTVENRANCQQPPEEMMSIPALTLGLVENLEKASDFIDSLEWDSLRKCRIAAIKEGPKATAGGIRVLDLSRRMLMLSEEGLSNRGKGEQEYLSPLWDRLGNETCPSLECRRIFEEGGIDSLIQRYSL